MVRSITVDDNDQISELFNTLSEPEVLDCPGG